ncbi:hypothetical protein [Streptomyces mayteni]
MTTEITTNEPPVLVERGLSPAAARRLTKLERLMYTAGGALGAVGPQLDIVPLNIGAMTVGVGAVAYLWNRTDNSPNLLVSCQRALPLLTWSATYTASMAVPGSSWWEFAAPAAWTALNWLAVPLTRSRGLRRAVDNLPQRITTQDQTPATHGASAAGPAGTGNPYADGLARMWAASPATGDTSLVGISQYALERPDFEAMILAPAGQPLPRTLDPAPPYTAARRTIAAVFDVPEGAVTLKPVPGYGPGRLAMRVAPSLAAEQAPQAAGAGGLEELWATYVFAPDGAAPGVTLVDYRFEDDDHGRPHRITMRIAARQSKKLRIDPDALCSALDLQDTSRLVIEGAGPREAVAYVYRTNPLLDVRPPTTEDLTMDASGRVAIGIAHDGKPARIAFFNPQTGRAQHGLTAGTTGAGKSGLMRILGAAQRISGIISWMADVQGGMSMPEMDGRIDWFARGPEETMEQLRTLHRVKVYREAHSNAQGRGDFDINGPWRLIMWTGDEVNRLLSSLDQEMRKEAAWMIGDLQKTGQKVGIGIDLALQSLHLKELGDNHEIREKGKEGHVLLMRTASSSTQNMGLDGILPPGQHVTLIPERIYEGASAEAIFEGNEEEGVPTFGMANLITEGKVILMRTFVMNKVDGRYPELEQLMDSRPMPALTDGEAAAAGPAYTSRHLAATPGTTPARPAADAMEAQAPAEAAATPATEQESFLPPPPAFGKKPTLKDRVLKTLKDHPDGLARREIRKAVGCGTDDGPAAGSVNNTIDQLTEEGTIVACGGSVYRLP